MTEPRVYGHTRSGQPITDADIEALAAEAEAGYDVDQLDCAASQARASCAGLVGGER